MMQEFLTLEEHGVVVKLYQMLARAQCRKLQRFAKLGNIHDVVRNPKPVQNFVVTQVRETVNAPLRVDGISGNTNNLCYISIWHFGFKQKEVVSGWLVFTRLSQVRVWDILTYPFFK